MKVIGMISEREKLTLPEGRKKLLLLSCCAPCSGSIMEALVASDIEFTIFFYNPNIHPQEEYEIRKEENKRFAKKYNIPFVDGHYDTDNWYQRVKGLEMEPERGERCTQCFEMRLEQAALYAHENGFDVISSSLGISRWKNMTQVNECGIRVAGHYDDLVYWTYNWRKKGGSARMLEISKEEQFYMQEYCGCEYSFRDANQWRREKGKEEIQLDVRKYYKKD